MVSVKLACAASLLSVALAATNTNNNAASSSTTLEADAIQSGSFFDGSNGLGAEDTQAVSQTSQNNFINFCSGQTLTNGLQITTGSCNGIVMGQIPAKTNMISSIITNPQLGDTLKAGQDFNITVQTQNLVAGSFTNADATYYAAPQSLQGGNVVGHTHITVQSLGNSLNPSSPPDATEFAFFKGINDDGNGNGLLAATVSGGLPAGNYRVCTLTSSSNHQPVLMPVAQRGSQDDCTKFTVTGNGGTTNVAANDGTNGLAAAALAQSAVNIGPGAITSATGKASTSTAAAGNNNAAKSSSTKAAATTKTTTTKAASAKASTAAKSGNGKGNGKGTGRNVRSERLNRLSRRTFVA